MAEFFTKEQLRQLSILNIYVESEKPGYWEEFRELYVNNYGWDLNDEKQLYTLKALFIIDKHGFEDLADELKDKLHVPENKAGFLERVIDSVKNLFVGKKVREDYPPVVQKALNCLDIIKASEKQLAADENNNDVKAKQEEIAAMKPLKQTSFLLGSAYGWQETMLADLDRYAEMLAKAQENPEANWQEDGVTEGPSDYLAVVESLKNARKVLKSEATVDEWREAVANFNSKLNAYEKGHRPVFSNHRTPITAERYRLIEGMANITEANLKVFDQLKKGIQENVRKVHVRKNSFKAGENTLLDIALIAGKSGLGVAASYHEEAFDHDAVLDEGKKMYPTINAVAVQKMLNERYERKTGLKTEAERNGLQTLKTVKSPKEMAKNYLSVKYRDEMHQVEERMDKEKIIDLKATIDVNDKIRAKFFNKEVEELADDFYFKRITQNNPTDWKQKWDDVMEKTSHSFNELRESLNETTLQTSEHLSEMLLAKALTDPKYKGALHAYADTIDNQENGNQDELNNLVDYIDNFLKTKYPNVIHDDTHTREEYLKKLANDEGMKKTIAGKVQEFCEKELFPKMDANMKNAAPVM